MTKLKVVFSKQFDKDIKLAQKRGLDLSKVKAVIEMIANGIKLPPKYKDHKLSGTNGQRDCHIQGDWVLIYKIFKDELELYCIRLGSHSDLF